MLTDENAFGCLFLREYLQKKPTAVVPVADPGVDLAALKAEQDAEDERERQKIRDRIEQELQEKREREMTLEQLKKKEAEEKALKEAEEAMRLAEQSPTLTVANYKSLWSKLAIGGSFQCKLKASPNLHAFADHLKAQGFHIVFASSPNTIDIELGICNIRPDGTGPWFIARFLASQANFSAVMKAEDPSIITTFVKKFALAKILKIETGGGGSAKQ